MTPAMAFIASALTVMAVLASLAPFMMPCAGMAVGDIDVPVPSLLHKINRPVAGVISMAMFSPFLRMPGGYVQVDRLPNDVNGRGLNHHRPGINELRPRDVADIDTAVKSGFADAHGNADVCGLDGGGGQGCENQNDDERGTLHVFSFRYSCGELTFKPPASVPASRRRLRSMFPEIGDLNHNGGKHSIIVMSKGRSEKRMVREMRETLPSGHLKSEKAGAVRPPPLTPQ